MRQVRKPIQSDLPKPVVLGEQRLSMTGILNARELGGYENVYGMKVKQRKLIRSGQLNNATKQDTATLITEYKLGMVIDLRSKREAKEFPDPRFFAVKYYNFPVTDDREKALPTYVGISDIEAYYGMMYGETARTAYKRFFERLLTVGNDKSVLFHSCYGKDRAGIAAALLLTLLDVPDHIIIEDYLLTNKVFSHTVQVGGREIPEPVYSGMAAASDNVYAHWLEYALARVMVEYGSVRDYVKEIAGLSENDIKELKRKYLE